LGIEPADNKSGNNFLTGEEELKIKEEAEEE
jgi:hypothetical protein